MAMYIHIFHSLSLSLPRVFSLTVFYHFIIFFLGGWWVVLIRGLVFQGDGLSTRKIRKPWMHELKQKIYEVV